MKISPGHLLSFLFELAKQDPHRVLFTFVDDEGHDSETRTAAELVQRIVRLKTYFEEGCHLKKGDVALLIYPPSMEFIDAFATCLATGIIAAPVYPPNLGRLENDLTKLKAIAESSNAKAILTNRAYRWGARMSSAKHLLSKTKAEWPPLPWYVTQGLDWFRAQSKADIINDPNDVAVLQFTSGSTSLPKGVRLTHKNIKHQLKFNQESLGLTLDSKSVMWVPQYHDLGLISGILAAICGNGSLWFMSPMSFLKRPSLWFDTIHRVRATHTASPNFGYELITRKTTPEVRARWDLSCLQLFMSAAEPIIPRTMDHFFEAFRSSGLSEDGFCPAYGLAEHTVGVTIGGRKRVKILRSSLVEKQIAKSDPSGDLEVIGCGTPKSGVNLHIVCPKTGSLLKEGQVGEIWVQSDSVADGYEGLGELNAKTFHELIPGKLGTWLKTGDLGFLHENELFVTGRKKDLIIVNGRNYHPEDLEEAIRHSHASIRAGGVVAFSVPGNSTEKLVLVVEILETKIITPDLTQEIISTIRNKISEFWGIPATVGLVPPKSLKKTTSGKIQRNACRQEWLENKLDCIEKSETKENSKVILEEKQTSAIDMTEALKNIPIEDRLDALVVSIRKAVDQQTTLDFSKIGLDDSLPDAGLDSLAIAELVSILEASLQKKLPASLFVEHPTLRKAAARILSELGVEHLEIETPVITLEAFPFRPWARGMAPAQTKIGIVGGGVGGLVSALELARLGYKDITLFEASSHCGGKVKTERIEDEWIDLGQVFFPDTFETVIALAQEMNCELIPYPTPSVYWDPNYGFEPAPARNPAKKWFQAVVKAARLHTHATYPFPTLTSGLDMPFGQFLESKKLLPIHPSFESDWNAMGYGIDTEIPASHVLALLQLTGRASFSCYLKNGNQELWTKLATHLEKKWGVKFRYQHPVEKITPSTAGALIFAQGQNWHFNEVILAVPPFILEQVLPQQDPLQPYLSQFEYYGFHVQSFKSKDLKKEGNIFVPNFAKQTGKTMIFGSCRNHLDWYISGQYSASHGKKIEPLPLETMQKDVSEVVTQMGAKIEKFGPHSSWKYFPHLRKDPSRILKEIESLQGHRHLWTTGSWISFETTEHVMRHAQHLVQTCFDPASTGVMKVPHSVALEVEVPF